MIMITYDHNNDNADNHYDNDDGDDARDDGGDDDQMPQTVLITAWLYQYCSIFSHGVK